MVLLSRVPLAVSSDRELWPRAGAGNRDALPWELREVITVEDCAEVRRLSRAEGLPVEEVTRHRGLTRNTVRAGCARTARDVPARAAGFGR